MSTELISLLPLDVGFDLRVTKTLVRLTGLCVAYLNPAGKKCRTTGCIETVVEELAAAGYHVVVAQTPTGQDVQCTPTSSAPIGDGFHGENVTWSVRDRTDTYWCTGASILQAIQRAEWTPDQIHPLAERR